MSDLTATNCGCSNNCGNNSFGFGGGCSSWIWIILLFSCCGNNNGGFLGGCGNNNGCDNNNNCCEWIIWILLLSCFCGGNNNSCC